MELTKDEMKQLFFSPLYIFYIVAGAGRAPEKLTDMHIIKALEFGLHAEDELSEALFHQIKSNLHKIFAGFPKERVTEPGYREAYLAELEKTSQVLERIEPAEGIRRALSSYAAYIAAGGIFGETATASSTMEDQAAAVGRILLRDCAGKMS